jgi:hypothetical protein
MAFLINPIEANQFMSRITNLFGLLMPLPSECTHSEAEDCPLIKAAMNVGFVIEQQLNRCNTEEEFKLMSEKSAEIFKDFVLEFKPCPELKAFIGGNVLTTIHNITNTFARAN